MREVVRDNARARRTHAPTLRTATLTVAAGTVAAAVAAGGWLVGTGQPAAALRLVLACAGGGFLTWILVVGAATLFTPGLPGAHASRLGAGNALTLVRFVLVVPTVVLMSVDAWGAAIIAYALLALTDVADGIVARARKETGRFGAVMDPVADIVSTFAVFTVLALDGRLAGWVYVLLCVRYATLLLGTLAFFLAQGPLDIQATLPGKIVGVVQATGAVCIMFAAAVRRPLPPTAESILFAFLGLGFASIVVSQALIGWRLGRHTLHRNSSR